MVKTTVKKAVVKKTIKPKNKPPEVNFPQLKVLFYKYQGTLQQFLRDYKIKFTKPVELKTKMWVRERKKFLEKISNE